jgi:hypothetical protein
LSGELWEVKKERIKKASVHGNLPGWDLRSVSIFIDQKNMNSPKLNLINNCLPPKENWFIDLLIFFLLFIQVKK